MLFSYITTYKVTTRYERDRVASGNERDSTLVKLLISKIKELEKLQEARM
jgi:hypothetical protein